MATLDSNSKNKAEEEEEDIYQFIFTMNSPYDMEEEGKVSSSSENTPVYQKIDDEGSPHAVETGTTKRLDMDALDINLGIPVLRVNVESLEEKPWRKIGADTSDYFNYGFDEESWKVYCKKHAKNKRANAKKARTKIMVQEGHSRHGKAESCCSYPFLHSRSVLASRESSPAIDVIGGQPGSSRVKVCQSLSNEGSNTQLVTEMSPEEKRFTSFEQSPSFNFTTVYTTCTPPPRSLFVPEGPSLSSSEHSKGFDDPSTSPCSPGVSSAIPGSKASSTKMIDTAKASECHIKQDMEDRGDKDSDRYKEYDHDHNSKDSKRGRDKERQSCSSSHNSWWRKKHWVTAEYQCHCFEGFSREKEKHRKRHRDTSKGRRKSCSSSSSSRSRRDDGEDRDSQSIHKHKKAKRNRKDKEPNEMFSAD